MIAQLQPYMIVIFPPSVVLSLTFDLLLLAPVITSFKPITLLLAVNITASTTLLAPEKKTIPFQPSSALQSHSRVVFMGNSFWASCCQEVHTSKQITNFPAICSTTTSTVSLTSPNPFSAVLSLNTIRFQPLQSRWTTWHPWIPIFFQ